MVTETVFIIFLTIILIAVIGDFMVPFIIGTKYPGYSHLIHTVSALGTSKSPVKKYESINLIIVGILFTIFSIGQWLLFTQKNWGNYLYLVGLLIFGIGSIFAGLYPEDSTGEAETVSGRIHGIASGIGFIFLILNPLWAIWISEFEHLKIVNLIFFIFAILTFILFLFSEKKITGFFKYTGLFQRINMLILYGNIIMNYTLIKN
jgi:hypothetical protein